MAKILPTPATMGTNQRRTCGGWPAHVRMGHGTTNQNVLVSWTEPLNWSNRLSDVFLMDDSIQNWPAMWVELQGCGGCSATESRLFLDCINQRRQLRLKKTKKRCTCKEIFRSGGLLKTLRLTLTQLVLLCYFGQGRLFVHTLRNKIWDNSGPLNLFH